MHINQFNKSTCELRSFKKPYDKYKDMKLAIKLIEKGDNPIFQDEEQTVSSPINDKDYHYDTKRGYRNFGANRLKVYLKDTNAIKYRTYIARSRTIDKLRLFR